MKYIQIYVILLVGLFLLNGCGGDCDDYTFGVEPCGKGENCVEIQILDIPTTVAIVSESKEYIITNDSAYNRLKSLDSLYSYPMPEKVEWPSIDFAKHILIGRYTDFGGGTLVGTSYKCIKTEDAYIFYITNISSGNYDELGIKYGWILAPPNTDTAKIKFEINEIKCRK